MQAITHSTRPAAWRDRQEVTFILFWSITKKNMLYLAYMSEYEHEKPLFWIGSSLGDLKDCPDEVQDFVGYALHWAQRGRDCEIIIKNY
jgi:hypothetical protein